MNLHRCLSALSFLVLLVAVPALAQVEECCWLPDNGNGTADLPPNCSVGYAGPMQIRDGLPPGSTLNAAARLVNFTAVVRNPGGTLGGETHQWNADLELALTGTGVFAAYNRFLVIPVNGQTHSAPRTPFAPVQSFAMDLYALQGQITLDPDFDLLRVTAGAAFGMPSPGQTVLTQSGSGWAVDSFFDITSRIDFIGRPGGPFGGMSGSTTDQLVRFDMCHEQPTPAVPATWGHLKASYR
jgi:hypothetical protein